MWFFPLLRRSTFSTDGSKFIDVYFIINIGVHAHSAHDAEVCHKVLNGYVEKEKDTDVSKYNLP